MWRELYFQNEQFERGINRLLNSGTVHVNHSTGRITPIHHSLDAGANWLFFGHVTALRDCHLWHQIMFNYFDIVPEFCKLRCYKVVTKVRNFLEAIQFYNAMLASPHHRADLMPMHGKVGIDERYYSSGHFNAFVYCDGPDDAHVKYTAVRALVDDLIPTGPDIPIIIKRSCTEFERKFGPTNTPFWQSMSPEELDIQHRLEDICDSELISAVQPDWIKNKIIAKMVRWANTVGDKSWLEYFDGPDFLTAHAVTYHEQPVTQGAKQVKNTPKPKAALKPKHKEK